jgi:hypothetical protein
MLPSLNSSVSTLFNQSQASGHESPIMTISLYLFSSTLDEAHFPRRGVGDTGDISEGWLRRSIHKPKTNMFCKSSVKHCVQDLHLSGFVKSPRFQPILRLFSYRNLPLGFETAWVLFEIFNEGGKSFFARNYGHQNIPSRVSLAVPVPRRGCT